jgi:hypothetical protein
LNKSNLEVGLKFSAAKQRLFSHDAGFLGYIVLLFSECFNVSISFQPFFFDLGFVVAPY